MLCFTRGLGEERMTVEHVLVTRYAIDLKPPKGVTRMLNVLTEKYYNWDGKKWVEEKD